MTSSEIIQVFDDCLVYVYGNKFARDNPHKTDRATADSWAAKGLTVLVATIVCYEQMSRLHERFLRFGEGRDRSLVPHSLKIFDDNIEVAIRVSKGTEIDWAERSLSSWRSRCKGWMKNKDLWRENMWGTEPNTATTRVPRMIIQELKIHA